MNGLYPCSHKLISQILGYCMDDLTASAMVCRIILCSWKEAFVSIKHSVSNSASSHHVRPQGRVNIGCK